MKNYNVAIAGATGAVGSIFLSILEQRNFPVKNLLPLASTRSVGKRIKFKGEEIEVKELKKDSFKGVDIALFSAGANRSLEFAPYAVESGAIVIDNSSAFRMDENVPLIVPEVNPKDLKNHKGIIANPNCSTTIMVVAIKPIYDLSKIKRIIVSTYQAVSGAGAKGIIELQDQIKMMVDGFENEIKSKVFPTRIAYNVIPHIDVFLDNAYTKEEMKMVNETRKVMGDNDIKVSATAARVPVFTSHSEAINLETEEKISIEDCINSLKKAPGIVVKDDFKNKIYPTTIDSSNKDEVYVGRIREDISCQNGIVMWVVGDQLRKGAALNAVQIAELLIKDNLI